jgi:hypothetical protein
MIACGSFRACGVRHRTSEFGLPRGLVASGIGGKGADVYATQHLFAGYLRLFGFIGPRAQQIETELLPTTDFLANFHHIASCRSIRSETVSISSMCCEAGF